MKARKAWRVVREVVDEADIVVEVVDARDPHWDEEQKTGETNPGRGGEAPAHSHEQS